MPFYATSIFLLACNTGTDPSTARGAASDVFEAASSDAEAAAMVARSLAEGVTLSTVQVPIVNLDEPVRKVGCQIRYDIAKAGLLGDPTWGLVPGSGHDCTDETAASKARRNADNWLAAMTMARSDSRDALLERARHSEEMAGSRKELLMRAAAWEVPFDLDRCVDDRVARLAFRSQTLIATNCSLFMDPGYREGQFRDQLHAAAESAQATLDRSPIRGTPVLDQATVAACQAALAPSPLAVPGDTSALATGQAVAFPMEVFAGETVTIYLDADEIDPVLVLMSGDCTRTLAVNDDWRGRMSRVVHRSREAGTLVAVARATRDEPQGDLRLSVEVEGVPTLTAARRAELEDFIGWVGALGAEETVAAWRAQLDPHLQSSCADQAMMRSDEFAHHRVGRQAVENCLDDLEQSLAIYKEKRVATSGLSGLLGSILSVGE